MSTIPYLLEPLELAALLPHADLLVVDVGKRDAHLFGHIPGAVHLDYANLIFTPPATDKVERALEAIGVTDDKHIVAYDDQGNARASRLLWTLEALGHRRASLLNGGLAAWRREGYALARGVGAATPSAPSAFTVKWNASVVADKSHILTVLNDDRVALLDARTPAEYAGEKVRAARGGHIPGAVNLNWLDTMDADGRFKPAAALTAMLTARGVTPDREVITYCQTHHRSSHSFVMLRHLGFDKVRGYPGSWSEWGNDPALPVE